MSFLLRIVLCAVVVGAVLAGIVALVAWAS
jgi:hypothetical protein